MIEKLLKYPSSLQENKKWKKFQIGGVNNSSFIQNDWLVDWLIDWFAKQSYYRSYILWSLIAFENRCAA